MLRTAIAAAFIFATPASSGPLGDLCDLNEDHFGLDRCQGYIRGVMDAAFRAEMAGDAPICGYEDADRLLVAALLGNEAAAQRPDDDLSFVQSRIADRYPCKE